MELHRISERYSVKLRTVHDDSFKTKLRSPMVDRHDNPMVSNARNVLSGAGSRSLYDRKVEMKSQGNSEESQRKEFFCGSDPTHSLVQSGLAVARKRRIHQQVSINNDQLFYFRFLIVQIDFIILKCEIYKEWIVLNSQT